MVGLPELYPLISSCIFLVRSFYLDFLCVPRLIFCLLELVLSSLLYLQLSVLRYCPPDAI
jgi:hypothetical protein